MLPCGDDGGGNTEGAEFSDDGADLDRLGAGAIHEDETHSSQRAFEGAFGGNSQRWEAA